jgi:guanine nucleotide-binding protein subunit alpha
MRSIIDTMDELGLAIHPSKRRYVAMVDAEPPINTGESFPLPYLEAVKALWADDQIQKCYAKAHEYALQENLV